MSFVEKLKSLEKTQYSERLKLEELTCAEGYKIINLRPMDTKFESTLLAVIEDPKVPTKKCSVYLLRRYAVNLTSDEVQEISSGNYKLKYKGNDAKNNPEIEIVKINDTEGYKVDTKFESALLAIMEDPRV